MDKNNFKLLLSGDMKDLKATIDDVKKMSVAGIEKLTSEIEVNSDEIINILEEESTSEREILDYATIKEATVSKIELHIQTLQHRLLESDCTNTLLTQDIQEIIWVLTNLKEQIENFEGFESTVVFAE